MNIYLVDRTDDWGYDDYMAFVVIAKDAKSAKQFTINKYHGDYSGWTTYDKLKAKLIGTTNKKRTAIVLDSFNAG